MQPSACSPINALRCRITSTPWNRFARHFSICECKKIRMVVVAQRPNHAVEFRAMFKYNKLSVSDWFQQLFGDDEAVKFYWPPI